jgi:putative methionine-R-sulfoxide reductase with GAF domain
VNVGDVAADANYLTALGDTRSEIIVPIVDGVRHVVIGTIDVESELVHAFDEATQALLETCAEIVRPIWYGNS